MFLNDSNENRLTRVLIASALVFSVGLFVFAFNRSFPDESLHATSVIRNYVETNDRVFIDAIPEIDQIIESVGMSSFNTEESRVYSAILPHYTLVGEKLDSYWHELSVRSNPDVIVIVSPAHWDQGGELIQTMNGVWDTPFGEVKSSASNVNKLIGSGVAEENFSSFEFEHGISVHTPYLAHYFSDIPIVPILATSYSATKDALQLNDVLSSSLDGEVLYVSSIDFSHYLSKSESDQFDEETRGFIRNREYNSIDGLESKHIDSPFALSAYLDWSDREDCRNREVWHQHNGELFPNIRPEDGTSYFVYFCEETPKLSIQAVGDIMLSRAVDGSLAREPEERLVDADFLLSRTLESPDVRFGNLESVISDIRTPSSKSIQFGADPGTLLFLKRLGFTHLSVSNNHSEDHGKSAWSDSNLRLKQDGLVPVGGYFNETEYVSESINGQLVAFFAFQNLTAPFDLDSSLEAIKEVEDSHDYTVISMHWGHEYIHDQHSSQVEIGRAFVEC